MGGLFYSEFLEGELRLGEAMVKEGLITNELLAKALERQIIFGGRLGTNLVEMGAINEETLAKFLAKALRVPYAEPSSFHEVPQDIIDSMPKELAQKYTAFPIKRERNRLHLAMKDPNDIPALDELRFIVGLDIRPYIASEMRIVFALEKYYGIKRDLRYVSVRDESFDAPAVAPAAAPAAPPEPAAVLPEADEESFLGDESQADIYAQGLFDEPSPGADQPPPYVTETEARPQPSPPPPPPVFQPPPPPEPSPAVSASPPEADPYSILASPGDREQIAGAVISAALRDVSRAALFMVKGGMLTGWRAAGQGLDDSAVSPIAIDLAEPTLFKEVVEDKVFYKGPILQIPQNSSLLEAMGGQYPQEAIAYPLIIKGKVVGVLYGDNGRGAFITGNVERLGGLMAKASMSLEILILKTKILAGE